MNPSSTQEEDPPAARTHRSGWRRFDPRRSFAAAIGWAVLALMGVVAFASAEWAADLVQRHRSAESVAQLQRSATRGADALMGRILIRCAAMRTLAADLRPAEAGTPATAARLRSLARLLPETAWIGIRDHTGRLLSASSEDHGFAPAPDPAWFAQALQAPVLAAVPDGSGSFGASFLVIAVPLTDAAGSAFGVLAARIPTTWLHGELDQRLRLVDPDADLEAVLLDPAGRAVAGSAGLLGSPPDADPSGRGAFLVASAPLASADTEIPAAARWRILLRQPLAHALAPVRQARRTVLLGVAAIGLAGALTAVALARWLTRRLDALAGQAREVRRGARASIDVPPGHDELHTIGLTLAELVAHLRAERDGLARINAELDARVSERAVQIERLEREARDAELERERLRLARGLHDTLANSLVSLITQIRLVRKLHERWDAARLDAELAQAEQVATQGLADARATIGRMRRSAAAPRPLGAGLAALLDELGARCALRVEQTIDPEAAALSGARADLVLGIAREALRNVERHSGARHLRLTLARAPADADSGVRPARWRLELADDGTGFDPQDPAPQGHYGLVGLRERAQQLGASLTLDSAPGRGSRVILCFDP